MLELRGDETTLTLDDEPTLEILTLDLTLETDVALELTGATLDATTPAHTAPVIVGTCALLLPFTPCTPNSTLEPTAILLFQFNDVAE